MNNAKNINSQNKKASREHVTIGPVLISLDAIMATDPEVLTAAIARHASNEDGDFGHAMARERGVALDVNDWFSAHHSDGHELHVVTDRRSGTTMVLLAQS